MTILSKWDKASREDYINHLYLGTNGLSIHLESFEPPPPPPTHHHTHLHTQTQTDYRHRIKSGFRALTYIFDVIYDI